MKKYIKAYWAPFISDDVFYSWFIGDADECDAWIEQKKISARDRGHISFTEYTEATLQEILKLPMEQFSDMPLGDFLDLLTKTNHRD